MSREGRGGCGWCITGDHDHCVVLVEMGTKHSGGSYKFQGGKGDKTAPYPWRCPCGCERSFETKCFDCHRVGVETKRNRCVDRESCSRAERPVQPKVREGHL